MICAFQYNLFRTSKESTSNEGLTAVQMFAVDLPGEPGLLSGRPKESKQYD